MKLGECVGDTFSEKLDFCLKQRSETFKARWEKVINPALDEDALKTYLMEIKLNPLNCAHLHHVESHKMGRK